VPPSGGHPAGGFSCVFSVSPGPPPTEGWSTAVIFIAGNLPLVSEIAPLLIVIKLEQYDYAGATAIAAFMLLVSFALLLIINLLQRWNRARYA
jgi:ABC-type sulfate transport system permease component